MEIKMKREAIQSNLKKKYERRNGKKKKGEEKNARLR